MGTTYVSNAESPWILTMHMPETESLTVANHGLQYLRKEGKAVPVLNYEGESVNRSQVDTERKTCDIRTWKKKHMFIDISSTNIDTLVPSLYQCGVETRSIEVFWLLFQPLPNLPFNLSVISEIFATFLDLVLNCFMQQTLPTVNRKHFFMNTLYIESFCSQKKNAQQNPGLR
jgi:hypothetical protein